MVKINRRIGSFEEYSQSSKQIKEGKERNITLPTHNYVVGFKDFSKKYKTNHDNESTNTDIPNDNRG